VQTIVIGGGIAGLSLAWQLARNGRRVTLFEREQFAGTHSSARNAQIWLPIDDDETTAPLAHQSASMLSALLTSESAWLRRCTAIGIAPSEAHVAPMERGARKGACRVRVLEENELREMSPATERSNPNEPAVLVENAGILDPHVMISALLAAGKDAGVSVRTGEGVRRLIADTRVRGVELESGEIAAADEVAICAGAFSGELGAQVDAFVPLVPLRRHLVLLEADPRRAGTIVWRFAEPQVYYRPESGGVLASPCDETPFPPCLPGRDPAALEALAIALEPIAPSLIDARVRTSWACLRTYAHDRELVLGPDPRLPGLIWLTGFGGRGMTIAVGSAALCAAILRGEDHALANGMKPDRVYPDRLIPPA
jgi:D-arginine dehydrogenase